MLRSAASASRTPNVEWSHCGEAGPVSVQDFAYGGHMTPIHDHGWSSIHWIIGGGVEERYGDSQRAAKAGRMLLYEAGVEHQTRISRNARIIHLPLQPKRSPRGEAAAQTEVDPALFVDALAVACGVIAASPEFTCAHVADLGERLADSIARRSHARRRTLDAARLRTLLMPTRGRPSLDDAAARCGLSRGHAARFVRAALGCSIGEYHRARQIMRATPFLLAGEASLASIAQACGFSDQSHFGRAFRECVGVSPGAFQRMFGRRSPNAG